MLLTPGFRLGPYEIVAAIGAGGMGEVYRARDTKLGREIAIKVLPDLFANDPERIARFKREAQLLAALNHPHIAAIYGLEDAPSTGSGQAGVMALVMELVEGDDLAQRLAKGAMPLDETLAVARQLAQALEAAHDQGIVHRDLKPANIKVRTDGTVKILDFGLAKLTDDPAARSGPGSASLSPTLTSPVGMTAVGMILGTAAYMSPEQARGRAADKRCDVWAFGCVLFEMLAGRRPFAGDDVSEVLAFVITKEPEWSALPAGTPASLRRLLGRCLEKDPRRRLRDIGDALYDIEESAVPQPSPVSVGSVPRRRSRWLIGAAAAAALAAACALTAAVVWRMKPAPAAAVIRFPLTLPTGQQFTGTLGRTVAFAPDGAHLAYVANNRIYVRSMAENDARPVAGTDDATVRSRVSFAWSPDGQFLAYVTGGVLKKAPLSGGAATTICSVVVRDDTDPDLRAQYLSWSPAGLVFVSAGGIMRVSADGGTPVQIAAVDDKLERAQDPQLLPDGRTLLFAVARVTDILADRWDNADIVVQSAASAARKVVVHGGSSPRFVRSGHLLYAVDGALLAAPFDPARQQMTGPPVAVLEGVQRSFTTNLAQFSVADNGSLVYVPGTAGPSSARRNGLVTVALKGETSRLPTPEGPSYEFPRFSPDGAQVTFDTDDGKAADVWVYDLSRATAMRRLTFGGRNRYPIWSKDGRWITFQSDREGDLSLYRQRADGTGSAERLTKADAATAQVPQSWSPNGDVLLFTSNKGGVLDAWTGASNPGSTSTLFALSLKDRTSAPFAGVQSQDRAVNAEFSPDGDWVAYSAGIRPSTVYLRPFPLTGAVYQVSKNDDGHHPWWSHDGHELFYVPGPDGLVRLRVTLRPVVSFSDPVAIPRGGLNESPVTARNIDMSPDGARLIGVSGGPVTGPADAPSMQIVLNWFEELKRLAPSK